MRNASQLFLLEEVSSKWHNNFINIILIILTSQLPIIYGRALHSIWVFRKRMWIILWKPIVKKFFPFLSYPINKTTVVVYVVSILSLLFLAIIAYICLPYHISALENRRKNNESLSLCRSHTVVGWVAPYSYFISFLPRKCGLKTSPKSSKIYQPWRSSRIKWNWKSNSNNTRDLRVPDSISVVDK